MNPGGPPPGWYPNPAGTGPARWWDGTHWGAEADRPSDDRTELATPGVTHGVSGAGWASTPSVRPAAAARVRGPARPSKPMIIIGVVAIVVGVTAAVGGVAAAVQSDYIQAFVADPIDGPGAASRTLDAKEYTIYAEEPLRRNDIEIIGPGGELDLRARADTASITRGSDTFRSVAAFTVAESGRHTIEIHTDTDILIVPSMGSVAGALVLALALLGTSGLLVVVGVVLLLVGALRRARPGAVPAA